MAIPNRPPEDRLIFPRALRHARKAAGFRTQVDFADKCSVDPETVGRYERGHLRPNEHTVTHMVETLRAAHLPDADLAALEQAAEQDRRMFWSLEPIGAPAESADLPSDPRRNPSRPEPTTDSAGPDPSSEEIDDSEQQEYDVASFKSRQLFGLLKAGREAFLREGVKHHLDTTDDSEQQEFELSSPKLSQLYSDLRFGREASLREGRLRPLPPPPDGSCTKEQWFYASRAVQEAFAALWTDREHVRRGEITLSALHAKWSQQQPYCSPLRAVTIPPEEIVWSPEVMTTAYAMMEELNAWRWLHDVR